MIGESREKGQEEKVFDAAKMMHAAGLYAELSGGNAGGYRSISVALAAESGEPGGNHFGMVLMKTAQYRAAYPPSAVIRLTLKEE